MSEVTDACQILMLSGRVLMATAGLSVRAAMLMMKVLNTVYLSKWKGSTSLSRFRAIKGDDYEFINICSEDADKLMQIEREMESHNLLYAKLPDLCGGDGNTQYVIAKQDMHIFAAFLMDHVHGELKDIKVGPITESDYAKTAVHPETGEYTEEFKDLNESAKQEYRLMIEGPVEEKGKDHRREQETERRKQQAADYRKKPVRSKQEKQAEKAADGVHMPVFMSTVAWKPDKDKPAGGQRVGGRQQEERKWSILDRLIGKQNKDKPDDPGSGSRRSGDDRRTDLQGRDYDRSAQTYGTYGRDPAFAAVSEPDKLQIYTRGERRPADLSELLKQDEIRIHDEVARHGENVHIIYNQPLKEHEKWAMFPIQDGDQVVIIPRKDILQGCTSREQHFRVEPVDKRPQALLFAGLTYVVVNLKNGEQSLRSGYDLAAQINPASLTERQEKLNNITRNVAKNIGVDAVIPKVPAPKRKGR